MPHYLESINPLSEVTETWLDPIDVGAIQQWYSSTESSSGLKIFN